MQAVAFLAGVKDKKNLLFSPLSSRMSLGSPSSSFIQNVYPTDAASIFIERGGSQMEAEIKTKPGFTVMGLLERGTDGPKFIPPLWDKYFTRFDEVKGVIKNRIGYGVMANYDEGTKEFDYLAGHQVEPGTEVPEGLTTWDVPDRTYAVIPCTVPTIMEAYQFFYKEWLPTVDYEVCEGEPEFEYYPEDFDNIENSAMFMYFPIRKIGP
jgi:AraC family transcriptional regulator